MGASRGHAPAGERRLVGLHSAVLTPESRNQRRHQDAHRRSAGVENFRTKSGTTLYMPYLCSRGPHGEATRPCQLRAETSSTTTSSGTITSPVGACPRSHDRAPARCQSGRGVEASPQREIVRSCDHPEVGIVRIGPVAWSWAFARVVMITSDRNSCLASGSASSIQNQRLRCLTAT